MDEHYIELIENYFIEDKNETSILITPQDEEIDYSCRRKYCYCCLCFSFFSLLGLLAYLLTLLILSSH